MNYKYAYQLKHLIITGVGEIILFSAINYAIFKSFIYDSNLQDIIKFTSLIIFLFIIEPSIIILGKYLIKWGKKKRLVEINDDFIREYVNQKLTKEIRRNELKKISHIFEEIITMDGGGDFTTISFESINGKKIKIYSTKRKDFPKINHFIEFLKEYCKFYNILFEEILKTN